MKKIRFILGMMVLGTVLLSTQSCRKEPLPPIDKDPEEQLCNTKAEVVGVSPSLANNDLVGHYLLIDGQVYAVSGDADQISKYAYGTVLTVGYEIVPDCYLPAWITYPQVVGCVKLTCLQEMSIAH